MDSKTLLETQKVSQSINKNKESHIELDKNSNLYSDRFVPESMQVSKAQEHRKKHNDEQDISISELDMAMITDELVLEEGFEDHEELNLSDEDIVATDMARVQEFLKLLKKTGSIEENDILKEMEAIMRLHSDIWKSELNNYRNDESSKDIMLKDCAADCKEVRLMLLDLAEKYLATDKYWATRSGYRRKDLCQQIVRWASKGNDLAIKWETRMVGKKELDGVSPEMLNRSKEQFNIVKDRLNNPPDDESLTKEAVNGIHQIDKWILKHTTFEPGNDGMEEFQASIMRLSPRERMYIYYLVEKGKYKESDDLDVALSQFNYVPDLEKFKSSMVSIKIWKGFSKDSRILWNKLSDAMQQIKGTANGERLRHFEEMNQKGAKSVREKDKALREKNGSKSAKKSDIAELELERKYELRNSRLENVILSLRAYRDAMNKLEKKKEVGKKIKEAQKEADSLYEKLAYDIALLDSADKSMPLSIKGKVKDTSIDSKEGVEKLQSSTEGLTYVKYVAQGAGSADSAATAKDYVQWGFIDKLLEAAPAIKSGAGGMQALLSFSALMVDFSLMIKLGGDINGLDLSGRILDFGKKSVLTSKSAVETAALTSSYIHGVALADMTKGVTKQMNILAGVTTGFMAAANVAEYVGIAKRTKKISSAQETIKAKYEERIKESGALSDKEISDKRLEETILKMEERIEKSRKKQAKINTASVVFSGMAFVPVVGAGISAAGVLGNVLISMRNSKKDRKKLADEVISAYIKDRYDKEYQLRYNSMPMDMKKLLGKKKEIAIQRQKSVENYICAGLGYVDREKLLSAIQREMATYLHRRLFYKEEDGSKICKEDLKDSELLTKLKPYIDMAYGLGFNVKHPSQSGKGTGSGKPSIRKIFMKVKF